MDTKELEIQLAKATSEIQRLNLALAETEALELQHSETIDRMKKQLEREDKSCPPMLPDRPTEAGMYLHVSDEWGFVAASIYEDFHDATKLYAAFTNGAIMTLDSFDRMDTNGKWFGPIANPINRPEIKPIEEPVSEEVREATADLLLKSYILPRDQEGECVVCKIPCGLGRYTYVPCCLNCYATGRLRKWIESKVEEHFLEKKGN